AEVLDCPELSCAAHARLHFIYDQHDAMLIADSPKRGHEVCLRNDISAFALHGLDNNGSAVLGRNCGLEYCLFYITGDTLADAFARPPLQWKADRVCERNVG